MTADAPGPSASPRSPSEAGRGRFATTVFWAVLLLALFVWGRSTADGGATGPASSAGQQVGRTEPLPVAHRPLDDAARPVRLHIPSAGIRARVAPGGLDSRGGLAAPSYAHADRVAWYRDGPRPGAEGVALMTGHVDTDTRRAVFYALSTVGRGAKVRVTGEDGRTTEFTVESTEVVPGDRFDAARVYGPRTDGRAELRLLTCGGTFDRESRSYTSNVVVSAYLTGSGA